MPLNVSPLHRPMDQETLPLSQRPNVISEHIVRTITYRLPVPVAPVENLHDWFMVECAPIVDAISRDISKTTVFKEDELQGLVIKYWRDRVSEIFDPQNETAISVLDHIVQKTQQLAPSGFVPPPHSRSVFRAVDHNLLTAESLSYKPIGLREALEELETDVDADTLTVELARAVAFKLPLPDRIVDNPILWYHEHHDEMVGQELAKINESHPIHFVYCTKLVKEAWLERYQRTYNVTDVYEDGDAQYERAAEDSLSAVVTKHINAVGNETPGRVVDY